MPMKNHNQSYIMRLKSIARHILSKVGLYDLRAKKLQLKSVNKRDIFVVSYPKSGNTWVRFLIANLLHPDQEITFRNIEQFVPDLEKSRDRINASQSPRYIKAHNPKYSCYPKFIYIYRDARDVFVSYYYYLSQKNLFRGSFSEFLVAVAFNQDYFYGVWSEHVERAFQYAQAHPKDVLFIKYEQLLAAPFDEVLRIASFCGLTTASQAVENAVQKCNFENLQQVEARHGSEEEGSNAKFFRAGKHGQWKSMYSTEDMELLLKHCGNTLRRLGYID
jgi:hypothetical protein